KLARLFKRPIWEARVLAGYEKHTPIKTIEEALKATPFFEQNELDEADIEYLRPYLEMLDREVEWLLSQPKHTKPSRVPRVKIRSSTRKRDAIDEAIDAALAFGGGPVSDKDRQLIREILERQDAEESGEGDEE